MSIRLALSLSLTDEIACKTKRDPLSIRVIGVSREKSPRINCWVRSITPALPKFAFPLIPSNHYLTREIALNNRSSNAIGYISHEIVAELATQMERTIYAVVIVMLRVGVEIQGTMTNDPPLLSFTRSIGFVLANTKSLENENRCSEKNESSNRFDHRIERCEVDCELHPNDEEDQGDQPHGLPIGHRNHLKHFCSE